MIAVYFVTDGLAFMRQPLGCRDCFTETSGVRQGGHVRAHSIFAILLSILVPAGAQPQAVRQEAAIHITAPMAPPSWALLERELLRYNSVVLSLSCAAAS